MGRFKGTLGEQMTQWAQYWREQDREDLAELCAEIGVLWTPKWKQMLPWNSVRAARLRRRLDRLLAIYPKRLA